MPVRTRRCWCIQWRVQGRSRAAVRGWRRCPRSGTASQACCAGGEKFTHVSQDQGRAGVPVEYTVVDDAQCVPAPSAAQLHDAPDSSGRPCTTCHRSAGGVPGYTYSGTPRDSSADHNSSYSGASRYLPPGPSTQSLTSAPHKTSTLKPSKYLGHHAVSCLRTRNAAQHQPRAASPTFSSCVWQPLARVVLVS